MMSEDTKQLETQVMTVPEKARAIKIISNETYQKAGEILVEIKGLRKAVNKSFDPIISKAFAAHREAVAQKRKVEAPLAQAEGIIKPAMAAWDTDQERIRRAEEMRLQELARKQAEERQLAEASALEAQGDKKAADEVITAPVDVAPVVLQKTVPKVQGVSFREVWRGECIDKMALIKAAATDQKLSALLEPNNVAINQLARSLRESFLIPGCRSIKEKIVSGRIC